MKYKLSQKLEKQVEKLEPKFSKGGRFGWLHSTFDAFKTFLFVPATTTKRGAHIRDVNDLKRVMIVVVVALLPALLFGMYNVGYQHYRALGMEMSWFAEFWFGFWRVLPIVVVSYVVGLGIEFAAAQIKKEEVNEGFLVTGMLIPLVMPVDVPLWMVALATAFAVIFGKEVFGGTGMNIFNPALLARAFIFFGYTSKISGDKVWIAGMSGGEGIVDGFSGATPLASLAESGTLTTSASDLFWGLIPGSIGETSVLCILLGAVILLWTGVASWRTMLSVCLGGLGMGLIFNLIGATPYMNMPAYYHLLLGGFAFGAVFMATDPVTSSQTNTGKWISGVMIGAIAVLVRVVNPGYPEGMMLAILFMNALTPLIDHYIVQNNINRRKKRAKLVVK